VTAGALQPAQLGDILTAAQHEQLACPNCQCRHVHVMVTVDSQQPYPIRCTLRCFACPKLESSAKADDLVLTTRAWGLQ
jgi:hypothetical protein